MRASRYISAFVYFLLALLVNDQVLAQQLPEISSAIEGRKALVIGGHAAELAVEIHKRNPMRVYAYVPEKQACRTGQVFVDNKGLYGKITVHPGALPNLPLAPLHFDLIVLGAGTDEPATASFEAIYRFLRPGGRTIVLSESSRIPAWKRVFETLGLDQKRIRTEPWGFIYRKPGPDPDADWGCWFGNAFHTNVAANNDLVPPLVEVWGCELTRSSRHNWIVPIVHDRVVVYYQYQFAYMNAHDAYTGELLWSRKMPAQKHYGAKISNWIHVPAAVGGTVVVSTPQQMECMDIHTGKTRWKQPMPSDMDWDGMRHVSVHGNQYYLLVNKDKALRYDPKDGKATETKPVMPYHAGMKVGRYLFFPEKWSYSHRYMNWHVKDAQTQALLYTFKNSGRPRFSVSEKAGVVVCEDWGQSLKDGKRLWKIPWMEWSCSAPTVAGDLAWRVSSGVTYAQSLKTGKIVYMTRGSNSCVPPIIANNILYTMSNNTHRLRAFASSDLLKPPGKRGK